MKKAFTMIEMIFVIIVIGILSAIAIPRVSENHLNEAADQVISHIRYTQHLAMQDNKFDARDEDWYKMRWQIIFNHDAFSDEQWAYTIFSDRLGTHTGNPDLGEIAVNPQNPNQLLTGGFAGTIKYDNEKATKSMNLGNKYDVDAITFSKCGAHRVSFDSYGRPLKGNLKNYGSPYPANRVLKDEPCEITLKSGGDKIKIAIEPETGYVHVIP